MHQLLESTTSIQRFEFEHTAFTNERLFRPISQAITSSECVSELRFAHNVFSTGNTSALFQSILRNKRNLTTLCLHFSGVNDEQLHEDIISTLSRPDSLLRCFEFQSHLEGTFPGIQFRNLLRVIENSKLERFRIGYIQTPQQLQTLTESIPSMKLKGLEVDLRNYEEEGEFDRETIRQDLLHAVKNNFSLQSVKARILDVFMVESDLFDSVDEKQRLAFYANRNERLDQWVDNPETVEQQKVWPKVLALAEKAGSDPLFRGLRSVLGRDYVSLPNGRKRKRPRPNYYAP